MSEGLRFTISIALNIAFCVVLIITLSTPAPAADPCQCCDFCVRNVDELIDAINSANQSAGCSRICLLGETFPLTDCSPPNDCAFGGGIVINTCVTIESLVSGGSTIMRNSPLEFSVFFVGQAGNLTLINVTVKDGLGTPYLGGGAIINKGKLSLINCVITDNRAQDHRGGGIFNDDSGVAMILNSTIRNNSVLEEGVGGGICNDGVMEIIDSTVTENCTPDSGGGIANWGALKLVKSNVTENEGYSSGGIENGGTLELSNCTVSGNKAKKSNIPKGGGIGNSGTAIIKNSAIKNNSAICSPYFLYAVGGGIYNQGDGIYNQGSVQISNSTISQNRVECTLEEESWVVGGGIYNHEGTVTIVNSTITENRTECSTDISECGFGGGIFSDVNEGTVTITNSTITGNSADSVGGGIYNADYATLNLHGSLIAGNVAPRAAEIRNDPMALINANNYNLLGHSGQDIFHAFENFRLWPPWSPPVGLPSVTDIVATSDGNIPTALNHIIELTSDSNGGFTQTHALVDGSPAINWIPPCSSCPGCITTDPGGIPIAVDQRGVPRPQPEGGNCDIGAYEVSPPLVLYPSSSGISSERDQTMDIVWAGFSGSNVKINLYKVNKYLRKIEQAPNEGVYRWLVPASLKIGDDYTIQIVSASDSSQQDISDNPFAIFSPPPKVTHPNDAGVVVKDADTMDITWENFLGSNVKIYLYKGQKYLTKIADAPNCGSYPWEVPGLQAGSDYLIKIVSGSQSDISDNPFTVDVPPPEVIYPSDPGIEVMREQTIPINWEEFSGSNVRIYLFKGTKNVTKIAETQNDGAFEWEVPAWLKPGTDYRIKICSSSDSSQCDFSDNDFSIQ